jgi:hypothetical protein
MVGFIARPLAALRGHCQSHGASAASGTRDLIGVNHMAWTFASAHDLLAACTAGR